MKKQRTNWMEDADGRAVEGGADDDVGAALRDEEATSTTTATTATTATESRLQLGSSFSFRVTVCQIEDVSAQFVDVFCQFNFLDRTAEAFSTEPVKNSPNGKIVFNHVQNFTTTVTKNFIDVIKNKPLLFEIFGHYQQHPLHDHAKDTITTHHTPTRYRFSDLNISKPLYFNKVAPKRHYLTSHVLSKNDLLVWFEIQELSPSGEYKTARVDQGSEGLPGTGTFLLHQGIQRRIVVTMVMEKGVDLMWQGVEEVVVGRVRSTPEWFEPDNEHSTLSLNLFPAHYIKDESDGDSNELDGGRVYFKCETSWDTSLHNSHLLNTITPSGQQVFITVSVFLEVEQCSHPVSLTKDLSVVILSRDSRLTAARSLRSLIEMGLYRHPDCDKVTGLFELTLKKKTSLGTQRCMRRVLDTSGTYVRGEENLQGWRPRGDSLVGEHQWALERLCRLQLKEKTKHLLLLRETLKKNGMTDALKMMDEEALWRSVKKKKKKMMTERCGWHDDEDEEEEDDEEDEKERRCLKSLKEIINSQETEKEKEDMIEEEEEEKKKTTAGIEVESSGWGKASEETIKLSEKCLKIMIHSRKHNSYKEARKSLSSRENDEEYLTHAKKGSNAGNNIGANSRGADNNTNKGDDNDGCNKKDKNDANSFEKGYNGANGDSKAPVDITVNEDDDNDDVFQDHQGTGPKKSNSSENIGSMPVADLNEALCQDEQNLLVPFVHERRVSNVVSKKGYLFFMGSGDKEWMKRWVVIRRPFVFLYKHEKDRVERGVINLTTTQIEFSEEAQAMIATRNTFTMVTKQQGLLVQTTNSREFHGWLYALNPLLAGQIRSKSSRRRWSYRDDN